MMVRCGHYVLIFFCCCSLSLSIAENLTTTLVHDSFSQKLKRSEVVMDFIDDALWGASVDFFNEWGGAQRLNVLTVSFQSRSDIDLRKDLRLNVEFLLTTGQSGTTQRLYARNRRSTEGFELLSLYMAWKAYAEDYDLFNALSGLVLETRAGIINQNYLEAPLLVTSWGFIGLMEEISWDMYTEKYFDRARLIFQQSLPFSETDLMFQQQIKDTTLFFTGSLFLEKDFADMVFSKGSLTGFYFKDLSADVAQQGSLLGNRVLAHRVGADSEFPYPFYGLHLQAKTLLDLFPELNIELGMAFLWNLGEFETVNTGADFFKFSDYNKAQSLFISLHIPLFADITFIPSLERFVSQSNAAPAFYNSARYGHSRREGFIIGAKFQLKKYDIYVDVQYGLIRSISPYDAVGNPDYILFSVGRRYENQI